MKSTDLLRIEHELIHRMMIVAERGLNRLKSGESLPDGFFVAVADFFSEYADKYHFGKEEGMLFDEMEQAGVFTRQLPIESIRHDHFVGRAYINRLLQLTENSPDISGDDDELIETLEGFVNHIRHHARKEDRVLYPLSDTLISPERDRKLVEFFEDADRRYPGYQQKYSDLVREMEEFLDSAGIEPAY